MADDKKQLGKSNTTFRFSSGQVLALDEHQIASIPYLTAMVSSADRFDSARDEDGHYKLDPNINHQHFSLILQLLPFHSVRQVFTSLPEEENVIPIVALLDFLGLLPYSLPSLEEVNSTFFSSVVYSAYCEQHLRIVKQDVLQDMAVQFAIAMIKEEYDFDECRVMDQIYWFVMFILSANKWFEDKLRHHVHTTAKNCFAIFNPALLKSLKKLERTSKKEISKASSVLPNEQFGVSNTCIYSYLSTSITFDNESTESDRYSYLWSRSFRPKLPTRKLLRSIYENEEWFPCGAKSHNEDPSEIIYRRVLEIMYARLQNEVCQRAATELKQKRTNAMLFTENKIIECRHRRNCTEIHRKFACVIDDVNVRRSLSRRRGYISERTGLQQKENSYSVPRGWHSKRFFLDPFGYEILPQKIKDIFETQRVSEEIDALILQDICFLTPKLEHEHAKLVQSIRDDEEIYGDMDDEFGFPFFLRSLRYSPHRTEKERASSYEILLGRLYKDPYSVVNEIRALVLVGLNHVAHKQWCEWKEREEIIQLEKQLSRARKCEKSGFTEKKKNKSQPYQVSAPKPFLNRHFKNSRR